MLKRSLESIAKYYLKMRTVHPLRSLLVAPLAPTPHKKGWENRLLIINLEALGDLVIFTGVLKHYRERFPGTHLTLLIKSRTGLEPFLCPAFVDEILTVDYRRFAINPFYGYTLISSLRRKGFRRVVNQDFSASEIMGKIIATSLGAEEVVGSDGLALEYTHPFDFQNKKNLKFVEKRLLPRYTKVVHTKSIPHAKDGEAPFKALEYYAKILEEFSGRPVLDLATTLSVPSDSKEVVRRFNLQNKKYAVLNVSASMAFKRWPLEYFVEVSKVLTERGITPVLIGAPSDFAHSESFRVHVPESLNLAGKTSVGDLISLIHESVIVLTNDTSTVHIAVALRHPSISMEGGGPGGMLTGYGYPRINKWMRKRLDCYGDNWQCVRRVPLGAPVPCIESIEVGAVKEALEKLLSALEQGGTSPKDAFTIRY